MYLIVNCKILKYISLPISMCSTRYTIYVIQYTIIMVRGVNFRRVRSRNFVGLRFSLRTVRTVKILRGNLDMHFPLKNEQSSKREQSPKVFGMSKFVAERLADSFRAKWFHSKKYRET